MAVLVSGRLNFSFPSFDTEEAKTVVSMANKLLNRVKLAGRILLKGSFVYNEASSNDFSCFHRGLSSLDIAAITPEEVAEAKTFFPMEKFFIFGHARSGTTLLTRLVRIHPQVYCNYQAHFFTRAPLLQALVADPEVRAWLSRRSNRWNRGGDLSPVVLRAVGDFIMEREARREDKQGVKIRFVGDKSPNSLLDGEAVRLMVKVYPDARLIFIVRDGRDAALSHRFQAFIDNPQNLSAGDARLRADFINHPQLYLTGQRSIFTEKGLRQAAQGWVHNVVETDRIARQLLGNQYHSLRYEDLLSNPWDEMSSLWSFLGVDLNLPGLPDTLQNELQQNPDADWQQQKAAKIAGALHKGKRGTWREMFTVKDRQIFNAVASETLATWEYGL
jgi:hypothetical protein